MIVDIPMSILIPCVIGSIFAAGGTVYMAKDAKKKADNSVAKSDCGSHRKGLVDAIKELRDDVKNQTIVLHEVVGELKRMNGGSKTKDL